MPSLLSDRSMEAWTFAGEPSTPPLVAASAPRPNLVARQMSSLWRGCRARADESQGETSRWRGSVGDSSQTHVETRRVGACITITITVCRARVPSVPPHRGDESDSAPPFFLSTYYVQETRATANSEQRTASPSASELQQSGVFIKQSPLDSFRRRRGHLYILYASEPKHQL